MLALLFGISSLIISDEHSDVAFTENFRKFSKEPEKYV